MNLDHIFNWKLLAGSHEFPGPDGGTCINEAAIIAAGYQYKQVRSVGDCPPCFSPVLSTYLITLNDHMPNGERQKLMRFVIRLSGSADDATIEKERSKLIVIRTVQKILPPVLRAAGLERHAVACSRATTLDDAFVAAGCARDAARDDVNAYIAYSAAARAVLAAGYALTAYTYGVNYAARAAIRTGGWDACIDIAEEAFAIGNQASDLDVAAVSERLQRAKVT